MQLAKVQAITEVDGVDPHTYAALKLAPWTVGWMEADAAQEADANGSAQILAGRTPQSLATPETVAAAKPKRRTYKRRDIQAEQAVSDDQDGD